MVLPKIGAEVFAAPFGYGSPARTGFAGSAEGVSLETGATPFMDGGLRKLFREHFPEAQWTSVETGSTGAGVPDAEYCFPGGRQGWIEFKLCVANVVRIDPEQVAWAERRHRNGGPIFLAVRQKALQGPRRKAVDALHLYRGVQTRAVLLGGLATVPFARWDGGPARWDWDRIKQVLIGQNT